MMTSYGAFASLFCRALLQLGVCVYAEFRHEDASLEFWDKDTAPVASWERFEPDLQQFIAKWILCQHSSRCSWIRVQSDVDIDCNISSFDESISFDEDPVEMAEWLAMHHKSLAWERRVSGQRTMPYLFFRYNQYKLRQRRTVRYWLDPPPIKRGRKRTQKGELRLRKDQRLLPEIVGLICEFLK
jgi:hypothetical protein